MSNTIAESLAALQTAKSDIATAILNKGGSVQSGDGFSNFATRIGAIPSGGGSATESYVEYEYNVSGYLVGVKLVGMKKIQRSSFYGEKNLISADLSLSNTMAAIGDSAFYGCTALTSVIIPNSVTTMGISAFNTCINLKSVTLPNGLLGFATDCFRGCTSLEMDSLPNSLSYISNRVFFNCAKLAIKDIPVGVDLLEAQAFQGCTGLKTMKIRGYLGTGENSTNVFSGCTGLTHVWLSKDIPRIWATNNLNFPFINCSSSLILYTDVPTVANIPSLWGAYWNNYNSTSKLSTVYGVSESSFNNVVNTAYGKTIY